MRCLRCCGISVASQVPAWLAPPAFAVFSILPLPVRPPHACPHETSRRFRFFSAAQGREQCGTITPTTHTHERHTRTQQLSGSDHPSTPHRCPSYLCQRRRCVPSESRGGATCRRSGPAHGRLPPCIGQPGFTVLSRFAVLCSQISTTERATRRSTKSVPPRAQRSSTTRHRHARAHRHGSLGQRDARTAAAAANGKPGSSSK